MNPMVNHRALPTLSPKKPPNNVPPAPINIPRPTNKLDKLFGTSRIVNKYVVKKVDTLLPPIPWTALAINKIRKPSA